MTDAEEAFWAGLQKCTKRFSSSEIPSSYKIFLSIGQIYDQTGSRHKKYDEFISIVYSLIRQGLTRDWRKVLAYFLTNQDRLGLQYREGGQIS
jgi:hypothetical protein